MLAKKYIKPNLLEIQREAGKKKSIIVGKNDIKILIWWHMAQTWPTIIFAIAALHYLAGCFILNLIGCQYFKIWAKFQ